MWTCSESCCAKTVSDMFPFVHLMTSDFLMVMLLGKLMNLCKAGQQPLCYAGPSRF